MLLWGFRRQAGQWIRMPLTTAQKSQRYRDKLKANNPEKYEEQKKKSIQRAAKWQMTKLIATICKGPREKRQPKWMMHCKRTARDNEDPLGTVKQKKEPLTSAEVSKRYRDRLKANNPEKYEEMKKKSLERATNSYKARFIAVTEEEREQKRKFMNNKYRLANDSHENEIRNGRRVPHPLTSAEKSKRYRDKMKANNPEKYDILKKRSVQRARNSYVAKCTKDSVKKVRSTAECSVQRHIERRLQTENAQLHTKIENLNGSYNDLFIPSHLHGTNNVALPLTSAQKSQRYREKMKANNPGKYEKPKQRSVQRATCTKDSDQTIISAAEGSVQPCIERRLQTEDAPLHTEPDTLQRYNDHSKHVQIEQQQIATLSHNYEEMIQKLQDASEREVDFQSELSQSFERFFEDALFSEDSLQKAEDLMNHSFILDTDAPLLKHTTFINLILESNIRQCEP